MWKSAGRASSLRVLPWHLPYNRGKSTKKNEDNLEKYCRAGQATDDKMAHALCMLGT